MSEENIAQVFEILNDLNNRVKSLEFLVDDMPLIKKKLIALRVELDGVNNGLEENRLSGVDSAGGINPQYSELELRQIEGGGL